VAESQSSWLAEYIGVAVGGVATLATAIATGVAGWVHKRYTDDRKRLFRLQTHFEHIDARVGTLAAAMEKLIERQDNAEQEQHNQKILLTEIKTHVEWIRSEMEVSGYQRRRQQ